MKGYRQLTLEQRYQIQAGLSMGMNKREIARQLNVHRSTIYREVGRNVKRGASYRAQAAQGQYRTRRQVKGKKSRKIQGRLRWVVETKLRCGWSPEQISGRLRSEEGIQLSHETVYQHVLRDAKKPGWLRYCLRFGGYKHHRFRKSRWPRVRQKPIDQRPTEAALRQQIGHWERDLVESRVNGPALLTIVDRKSRYTKIQWLEKKTVKTVEQATLAALQPYDRINRTLTNDNGSEFQQPARIEQETGVGVYYCEPGAPWQRGSVENLNGLIRQYFRKRQRWTKADAFLAPALEETLNMRPRKLLGYRTPHEVFFDEEVQLLRGSLSQLGLKFSAPS